MFGLIREREFLIDALDQPVEGIPCQIFFKDHVGYDPPPFVGLLSALGMRGTSPQSAGIVPLLMCEIFQLTLIIGKF
jgi:hypothetical protein